MGPGTRVRYLTPLLLLPALLLAASVYYFTRETSSAEWVKHTVEVRLAVSHLLATLVDAETGQRGYIATGDREFLEPYDRARSHWERELRAVQDLTRDNGRQHGRTDEIERLARARMSMLADNLVRFDAGAPRIELVNRLREGKEVMDTIRVRLTEVDGEEARLLAERQENRAAHVRWTFLLLNAAFLAYVVVVTRVLILRKIAELERQRAEERERHLRFAETFIGVLGHDLRNPLNAIVMSAERLREAAPESEHKAIDRIVASGKRMNRMITQLLDVTRARLGGGLQVERRPVNLCEVVANAVDEIRAAYPEREIRWEGSKHTDGEWDPDRIAQVVSNLLANALQHSEPNSAPEVTLRASAADAELRIHNLGPPIPTELQGHLFEPYRRGDLARADGLGLGLYIAQQIVLAHGGTIEVRSTREEGTTFAVRLPRFPEEPHDVAATGELAPA